MNKSDIYQFLFFPRQTPTKKVKLSKSDINEIHISPQAKQTPNPDQPPRHHHPMCKHIQTLSSPRTPPNKPCP